MRISIIMEALTGKFDTDLNRTAKNANKRAKEMERSFKKLATTLGLGLSVGALVKFTKSTITAADSLLKTTQRIGGTVEALSELQHVADLSSVSWSTMEMGLQRMTRRIAEAAQGTGEAVKALQELGLSAEQVAALPLDKQFEVVAQALSEVEGQSDKTRLAMKLFDSEGVALLQTMTDGAAGIRAMRSEAQSLGKTLSTEQAEAARDANDAMTRMNATISSLARNMTISLVPAINAVVTGWNSILFDASPFPFEQQITKATEELERLEARLAHRENLGGAFGAWLTGENPDEMRARIAELRSNIDDLIDKQREALGLSGSSTITLTPRLDASAAIESIRSASGELDSVIAKQAADIDRLFQRMVISYETAEQQVARQMAEFDIVAHMFPPSEQERIRKAIKAPLLDGIEEVSTTVTKITQEQLHEMVAGTTEALEEINVFAEQASRNTQDIIARNLRNGFDDGVKGILQSFTDMISDMVAQALAANISGKLFGTDGVGGGGGLLSGVTSFLFGGGRATGGPVEAGMVYRVNENEPEFFRPDTGGQVIPLSKMPAGAGGVRVTQNIIVQGRVDSRTASQIQVEAARKQRISTARLG